MAGDDEIEAMGGASGGGADQADGDRVDAPGCAMSVVLVGMLALAVLSFPVMALAWHFGK